MSYCLDDLVQESINVVLSVLVYKILELEKNIKNLDKAIEQFVVVIPKYQCLTSIPGVGKVYATGLIAEINRFERKSDKIVKVRCIKLESEPIWKLSITKYTSDKTRESIFSLLLS
ncbi:hypothetical protein Q3C67_12835 [Enterococcus faecium]|nr:hypothetical protein [Enterococcus faecium]MDQ8240706.1 hypothetical protein [Enterococcus faecium]